MCCCFRLSGPFYPVLFLSERALNEFSVDLVGVCMRVEPGRAVRLPSVTTSREPRTAFRGLSPGFVVFMRTLVAASDCYFLVTGERNVLGLWKDRPVELKSWRAGV